MCISLVWEAPVWRPTGQFVGLLRASMSSCFLALSSAGTVLTVVVCRVSCASPSALNGGRYATSRAMTVYCWHRSKRQLFPLVVLRVTALALPAQSLERASPALSRRVAPGLYTGRGVYRSSCKQVASAADRCPGAWRPPATYSPLGYSYGGGGRDFTMAIFRLSRAGEISRGLWAQL